jgi:hypothetical protein
MTTGGGQCCEALSAIIGDPTTTEAIAQELP